MLHAGIEIARLRLGEGLSPEEALRFVAQGDADRNALDFDGAFAVAAKHGWDIFPSARDNTTAFRLALTQLLVRERPVWLDLVPLGRGKAVALLDDDQRQCFRIAGLLAIDDVASTWWDDMALLARDDLNRRLLAAGRIAERKTMEREARLLEGSGYAPSWVALEDNAAGFDIATWRDAGARWVEFMIEVKSSKIGEAFFITTREWSIAIRHPHDWELQVWVGDEAEPRVLTCLQLSPHIPQNQGSGMWEQARISIDAAAVGKE